MPINHDPRGKCRLSGITIAYNARDIETADIGLIVCFGKERRHASM
jgi:hypothetical protein